MHCHQLGCPLTSCQRASSEIHLRRKKTETEIPCKLTPDATELKHPRDLWQTPPVHVVSDGYGYNRIPAFWFTLNLPFNYLFEIHRFQRAVEELTTTAKDVGDTVPEEGDTQSCMLWLKWIA